MKVGVGRVLRWERKGARQGAAVEGGGMLWVLVVVDLERGFGVVVDGKW